jgi:hypothetical protein
MVVGALVVTGVFRLLTQNQKAGDLISNRGDFRDRATLATTQINRSITMAGFGITNMDVIRRGHGQTTDTLQLYVNSSERRTTLIDSAAAGATMVRVFKDSGFTAGCFMGITDSLRHEYVRVQRVEGNLTDGFQIHLSGGLTNAYKAGVPHIYPVQRERYFVDAQAKALVRLVDDRRIVIGDSISVFQVQLLNGSGAPATRHQDIRVVTFSIAGNYKAPSGTPSLMSFSSTVIPRNIL